MSWAKRVRKSLIGLAAGLLAGRRGTRKPLTPQDLQRHHFRASTQRMGVRFTESLRDAFRARWLRKRR